MSVDPADKPQDNLEELLQKMDNQLADLLDTLQEIADMGQRHDLMEDRYLVGVRVKIQEAALWRLAELTTEAGNTLQDNLRR